MKLTLIASTVVLSTFSIGAMADDSHSCNIEFNNDLVLNNSNVQLQAQGKTLWQISNDGQLILDGNTIKVNNDTRILLRDYQAGIRQQTSDTIAVVEDAMLLASEALTTVVTELTGKPLADYPAMEQALSKIREATDQIVVHQGDSIYLYGSRLDTIDQAFGADFEQAIEEAVTESMGGIMMLVGKAMTSGEGNFEQRMEAFGSKMEKFGEELEAKMDIKAAALEQRGDAICSQVSQLDALESQIQQHIPAMQQYDLFKKSDSTLSVSR